MKRFSKIFSLILSISMVFGSMTVSYAATELTTEAKAEVLYDLDLFSGISSSEFIPDLDGDADREQSAKMVAVALDWTIDTSAISGFFDVSDWAQPYVAVAVEEGVTNGIGTDSKGNEVFGAHDSITARQLATWFDRVITGSDSAWIDNASLNNDTGVDRGYLVDITYEALKETPVGESQSLIETIIGDDMALMKVAIEGGLIDPDGDNAIGNGPGTGSSPIGVYPGSDTGSITPISEKDIIKPTIVSIDVEDNDQIILTFSEALDDDTAEDDDYYTLYQEDEVDDIFDEIELTDDKEVTITFEEDLSGEYVILINGVEDTSGNEMYDYIVFEVDNDEIPTIKSIEVTDDDEIIVTFSEDIDEDTAEDEDNYTLFDDDDDEVDDIFDTIEMTDDDEVTITFTEDLDGDYTLEVDGVDDEDGDEVDDEEEFSTDDDDFTIEDIDVTDDDEIVITFSEDLDQDSAEDEDNYTLYDEDGDKVYSIFDDIELTDDDEVTITFDEDLDGDYTIDIDGVENEDGDEIDDDEDFEVDDDDSSPSIEDIDVEDADMIVITFSEDLDEDSANDEDNYTLYDEDGDEVDDDIFDDIGLTDDDEVTILFSEDLDGDYTIEIDGVEDEAGNEMDDDEDFEVDFDEESPTISDIDVSDEDMIVITFSEDVDEDSAEDDDYYTLYDEDGDEVDDIIDEIYLTDNDEVTIYFTEDLDGSYTIDIDGVEDEAGNEMNDDEDFDVD